MQQVSARLPHLVAHCFLDRDWIWLCDIDLSGDENKDTRAVLKEIGFRFCPKGHVMPDGKTLGTWSHSCRHPIFRRRAAQAKRHGVSDDEPEDCANLFRELGL